MTAPGVTLIVGGKSAKDRLAEGEAILSDYTHGMRASDLATKYGLSPATVYRRIDDAVKERIAPTVDAYREIQNSLLDDLMAKWAKQDAVAEEIIGQAIEKEDLPMMLRGFELRERALVGMTRTAERRAKLMGLDAPVKAEVRVTVEDDGVQGRIDAMVAEMSRRDAEVLDG